MFARTSLVFIILSIVLVFSNVGIFKSYGAGNATVTFGDAKLQKLMTEYVNWNVNVPTEELPEEGIK